MGAAQRHSHNKKYLLFSLYLFARQMGNAENERQKTFEAFKCPPKKWVIQAFNFTFISHVHRGIFDAAIYELQFRWNGVAIFNKLLDSNNAELKDIAI